MAEATRPVRAAAAVAHVSRRTDHGVCRAALGLVRPGEGVNRMRIGIAGFMHESNTFNPLRTDRAAFAAQSLTFGPSLLDEWRDAHHEVGAFIEAGQTLDFEPLPLLMAWATPSGPVTDDIF